MTEEEKTIILAVASGDQWESTKAEILRSCPDAELVRAFQTAVAAEEVTYAASAYANMPHLSAVILRCEFHRELMRRINEEHKTLDDLFYGKKQ